MKTVEIYNREYAENELFCLNKEPLFRSGLIIREIPHQRKINSWSVYSLEEAIVVSIEAASQRRECVDEFNEIETVQDLEWVIGRECQIITFEKFDPEECSQSELKLALKLDWLIKCSDGGFEGEENE